MPAGPPAREPVLPDPMHVLYCDHHGWLQDWLRKRLGNHFDAADLAHDTFLRVLKAQARTPPDRPRAYLCTIAKGLVVDLARRRALERAYHEALAALPRQDVPSLEAQAVMKDALFEIDAMLAGLGGKVRQAFLLSRLEGLPYPEIARRMGISPRSVHNYVARAMEHCCLLLP